MSPPGMLQVRISRSTRVSWQNPPCRRKGESSARGLSRRRRRADDATPTTATTTARLAWWSPGQQLIAAVELTGRRNPCSKTLRPERRRTEVHEVAHRHVGSLRHHRSDGEQKATNG